MRTRNYADTIAKEIPVNLYTSNYEMQNPDFDFFEPFVGTAAGLTKEQAAGSPFEDRYVIEFDQPISGYDIAPSQTMALVPAVRVLDDYTLEIAIPGGTPIGDGKNATIVFSAAG